MCFIALLIMQHVSGSQLMGARCRGTTVCLSPLPIHNRHMRMDTRLIRPPKLEIKPRSLILDALGVVQYFDQERQIVISHQPARTLLHTVHPKHTGVPVAPIRSVGVGRPHPWSRVRYLPKKTEFAFEQEFREGGSRVRGAVEVCEAEGVRVAGVGTQEAIGTREVFRYLLTMLAFSRVRSSTALDEADLRPAYRHYLGPIA